MKEIFFAHKLNTFKKVYATMLIVVFFVAFKAEATEIASWYGGGEKLNKHTANGEVFNPDFLTCASWYYSFDTKLKVTNIATGKSVIVRVNDRGPNKRLGRAIDLTKRAFSKIANTKEGLITVKIKKVK